MIRTSARCALLVVSDCPAEAPGLALFRDVLSAAGADTMSVEVVRIDTQDQAAARQFTGSPSFFLDGRDLLPDATMPPSVTCRLYRTSNGTLQPLPERESLVAAVARATRADRIS